MKKKIFAGLLALCLTLTLLPGTAAAATVVASGECGKQGDNLTWSLDDSGTLTISGTGEMQEEGECPWEKYKADPSGSVSIVHIELKDGITSIGSGAFSGCASLKSITIPNSLTSIGWGAFSECSNLEDISIPSGVTNISPSVFSGCSKLASISLPTEMGDSQFLYFGFSSCTSLESFSIPNGITQIGSGAFTGCLKLKDIFIPASVTFILSGAFSGCDSLENVEYSGTKSQWMKLVSNIDGSSVPILWPTVHCSDGIIEQKKMADGKKNVPYSSRAEFHSTNLGAYELIGSLPSGLSLDPETSIISGIPKESGTWNFQVRRKSGDGEENVLVMPRSLTILDNSSETTSLTDGVKYVPYSCHVEGKDYSVSSDTLTYWRYQLVEGTLPSGLSLSVDGVVSGVPKVDGTWNFQVSRTLTSGGGIGYALDDDGTAGDDLISCSLKILSNTDAAVKRPNDYNIIIPVGRPCPDDPNHFNKYEYTEEILKIDGPYDEFVRLFIDGTLLKQPDDYTAREGSTVITIHAQTFQHFGEGTHTIAAEFHAVNNGNIKVKRVAQNYTLTLGGTNNGGSSSSRGSSKPSKNPSVQKPQNSQEPAIPFTDVPLSAWYYEDVVWAYQEGVMQGLDGKRFGPDEKVSQATIVTVLSRLAKIDMSQFDGETEPDVPAGQYFTAAAVWAKRSGLMPAGGAFTGSEVTTRNQMAVMLTKYLASMGKDTATPAQSVTFEDSAEMSEEGANAFQVLYKYGIFRGTGGMKMEPAGSTTRAQFAALIHRIYDTAVS